MSRQRRIRDENGVSVYYDIDENDTQPSDGLGNPPSLPGAGVFDTISSVASSVAAKLTGKAAKKLAEKAAEKVIEKGAEKVGEKTGQLIGEKIFDRDRFNSKNSVLTNKNKGDQIIKKLQKLRHNVTSQRDVNPRTTSDVSVKSSTRSATRSVSQRFEELLQKI